LHPTVLRFSCLGAEAHYFDQRAAYQSSSAMAAIRLFGARATGNAAGSPVAGDPTALSTIIHGQALTLLRSCRR